MADIYNEQRVLGVHILGDDGGGAPDDEAYSDETGAADGSVIALLKGIYVQQAQMIALLDDIKTNTSA